MASVETWVDEIISAFIFWPPLPNHAPRVGAFVLQGLLDFVPIGRKIEALREVIRLRERQKSYRDLPGALDRAISHRNLLAHARGPIIAGTTGDSEKVAMYLPLRRDFSRQGSVESAFTRKDLRDKTKDVERLVQRLMHLFAELFQPDLLRPSTDPSDDLSRGPTQDG